MTVRSPLENLASVNGYLTRVHARMTSLFRAAVIEKLGQYENEVFVIRFSRDGEIRAPNEVAPTLAEAEAIATEMHTVEMPRSVTLTASNEGALPPEIVGAEASHRFDIYNRDGQLAMIQVRVDKDNGDKRYVPWTYWSDGVWRPAEPEGLLPIYGADTARHASRVFIHEGAKAARGGQQIAEDASHPFHEQFKTGAHIGWIAGVHQANRADWRQIVQSSPDDVVIICDNDFDGRIPLAAITRRFRCPVRVVEWGSGFPKGWDVADPLPSNLFYRDRYVGPFPLGVGRSTNWATDEIAPEGRGRPTFRIRDAFARSWCWIEQLQRLAQLDDPIRVLNREQFQARVAQFSHVQDTARYLLGGPHASVDNLTFEPGDKKRIVTTSNGTLLNQYVDQRIRPIAGDTAIWDGFMDYLIPDEDDRANLKQWMATVYSQPERRLYWGVLLLSRMQGVGKSTIANVMTRMIGERHCAQAGETTIMSDFNDWLAAKRLVVVHEIYAGQNWKAYNRLKSLMTEDEVTINTKHVTPYTIPNRVAFLCASNSMEALRLERADRRWFVPGVAEEKWPDAKYAELWEWIRGGGLHALAHQMVHCGDFVANLATAPGSVGKSQLIEASRPEEEIMLQILMEELQPGEAMSSADVWLWLREHLKGRVYITPHRAASVAKQMGYGMSERRARVNGHDNKTRFLAFDQETADALVDADPESRDAKVAAPETVFSRSKGM